MNIYSKLIKIFTLIVPFVCINSHNVLYKDILLIIIEAISFRTIKKSSPGSRDRVLNVTHIYKVTLLKAFSLFRQMNQ